SPIGAKGVWLGVVHLSMYTVPAYVMILLSMISIILLLFCFEEKYSGIIDIDEEKDPYLVIPKFDKLAAAVLIYMWYVEQSIVTTIEVMASPLTIAMFNWNNSEAILYNGLIQSASCVISVINYFAIAYTRIGKFEKRRMMLFALILFLIHYTVNMPWPFYPEKMEFIQVNGTFTDDTTINGGCYQQYTWCEWTTRTPIYLYIVSATLIFGLAFPYFATPTGTIYSQVLGPRKQGFMQGIFALFGSVARTIGPLITTNLFERFGYLYPNLVQFLQIVVALALTIIFYRRLVPLRLIPRVGTFAKYKRGVFCHL
uniref:Major facilitator superfamily (MFS) profile domain-containing protein n=2 Tax=Parascaris univalens TaxID=6257 RepID=A0A914ZQ53_PARUN